MSKNLSSILKYGIIFKHLLGELAVFIWCLRDRLNFTNFSIPCRLPFGCRILAYGDTMGYNFFRYAYFKKPYEANETQFICRFIKKNMVVIDIGANHGYYTLLISKIIDGEGIVIAFEPVNSLVKKLKKNITLNRLKNIIVEPYAVSLKEETREFYLCLDGKESLSSLRLPSNDVFCRKKKIKINTIFLDKYLHDKEITKVDFIKIDAEGGELNILKGGVDLLVNFRPVIMCEIDEKRTIPWGYTPSEIYNFLKAHNYLLFEICNNGYISISSFKGQYNICYNIIAVPLEKVESENIQKLILKNNEC